MEQNRGDEMQIRDIRALRSAGVELVARCSLVQGEGWTCDVYPWDDNQRSRGAGPEIETARGEVRFFRSLDHLAATLRQVDIHRFEVVL